MIFDTHCHLNFSAFDENVDQTIKDAVKKGVTRFVIPGTDVATSEKAIMIAEAYDNAYAAVGIHPHHIFEVQSSKFKDQKKERTSEVEEERSDGKTSEVKTASVKEMSDRIYQDLLTEIEVMLINKKVVAVGEVGVDRHYYQNTRYKNYHIDESFIELQKEFLVAQIELAAKYKKSLILHNREAKHDLLEVLTENRKLITDSRLVFHCCEPDDELLDFAKKHQIFIGVDGDVTYNAKKQEFVKQIPLELLVLETDSPYLLPEPLRSQKKFPNKPENLISIAKFIAELRQISVEKLIETTANNAKRLFQIPL